MTSVINLESADNPAAISGWYGIAQLTRLAFDGVDLKPLWQELADKINGGTAHAGNWMDLAVVSQLLGDQKTGLDLQKAALLHQRIYRSPFNGEGPELRLLAIAAELDIGSNTPVEFLTRGSNVELTTLYVVPGQPLPDPIPAHDIAIVVAADDDRAKSALSEIEALVANWPRPVLNLPRSIGQLDRDRLHPLIHTIPGLLIPVALRITRDRLAAYGQGNGEGLEACPFPVIVRPVGSHAGKGLSKIDEPSGIAGYLEGQDAPEFFLSPFVDYSSADGEFRKYRLVFVDGRPFACHMAILDQWDIWYLNANMTTDAGKRAEEADFMVRFDEAFAARHAGALKALADRIGLDYFMIDCAETKDGELLVFEADNTAIVHDMDPVDIFPYKVPQMRKIFDAFVALLYRRAGRSPGA